MFTQALGTSTTGFEGAFRFLADVQGLSTSAGRHPSADLLPIFNASYRSLRELVTTYGYTQFIRRGTTTALPTTPVETGENYATIQTVLGTDQIKAFDIRLSGRDWYRLPEITLLQLRDWPTFETSTPSEPRGWCWLDAGSVSGSTFTPGTIAITPVPSSGSFALWSSTEFTDLVSTTDVYLYHTEDWRQWHLFDSMAKIVGARDKDTSSKLQFVMSRLNPSIEGSPAFNIKAQRPTAAGPKTWTRASSYRSPGGGGWR